MRKLLNANFSRLWRCKIFWILELGTFLFSAIAYLFVGVNIKNIGVDWIMRNANFYLFVVLLYVGVLTSIFSSLFFGTEYSDGTIRNKLMVGHSRKSIYLSNWILNATVTVLLLMAHYLAAVVIGIPVGGIVVVSAIDQLLLKIVYSFVIALTYTAIFTMTTMVNNNKASCAVINILLALLLLIAGFMIFSALEQPEMKYRMVLQNDGSYLMEENIPNPRYISGGLRTVYTIAEAVMPAAFSVRLASDNFAFYHVVGCVILTVLLTVLGETWFKKKDIK